MYVVAKGLFCLASNTNRVCGMFSSTCASTMKLVLFVYLWNVPTMSFRLPDIFHMTYFAFLYFLFCFWNKTTNKSYTYVHIHCAVIVWLTMCVFGWLCPSVCFDGWLLGILNTINTLQQQQQLHIHLATNHIINNTNKSSELHRD